MMTLIPRDGAVLGAENAGGGNQWLPWASSACHGQAALDCAIGATVRDTQSAFHEVGPTHKRTRAHGTKNVPWLPLPTRRERRKGESRQGAGGLGTLFRGVKTRNVVENKGSALGRAKQRPDMCMKTKEITAQSRYVLENKST
jgi:hypothetical protein